MTNSAIEERYGDQLAELKTLGALVEENQAYLARRITDSARLPMSFTQLDTASLAAILNNYGDFLTQLHEGELPVKNVDVINREVRGDTAVLLPYNGPAMCFGLGYAPLRILGANARIKPARESQNFFQTFRALVSENGLDEMLANPDGSSIFSEQGGREFLADHLQRASPTKVMQIYGHDSYITEAVKARIMEKKDDFRLILEGPGKNRFVVTAPLTDYDAAAETIARLGTINGGQTCMGAEIFDVHADIASALIPKIVDAARAIGVGDPYDAANAVGPMRPRMFATVYRHVEDALKKGATLEFMTPSADGHRLAENVGDDGRVPAGELPKFTKPMYDDEYGYVPVFVLSGVNDKMAVRREETFGPIIAVGSFTDDRELINPIREAKYGLGASIFGDDLAEQHADLRETLIANNGSVYENMYMFEPGVGWNALTTPWGGWKASRFTLLPMQFEGHPGILEQKTGPSYTFVDFSEVRR